MSKKLTRDADGNAPANEPDRHMTSRTQMGGVLNRLLPVWEIAALFVAERDAPTRAPVGRSPLDHHDARLNGVFNVFESH